MVVLYPVQETKEWFSNTTMAVPALWRDKLELQEEIKRLEVALSQQANPSLSEKRLLDENNELRSLLSATTSRRIAAAVIARPDQLPYDVVQIDQGSDVGVAVGAPVYANQEEVIGVVSQTYANSALITLFSTPGFIGTGYVEGSNILAKVEGIGGGALRVSMPQGIPLQVGSLVHVPSIQPGVIGEIVSVENEPTQPQQFGYIVHTDALQQLRYVSVGEVVDIHADEVSVQQYIADINAVVEIPDVEVGTSTATSTASSTDQIDA